MKPRKMTLAEHVLLELLKECQRDLKLDRPPTSEEFHQWLRETSPQLYWKEIEQIVNPVGIQP